MKVWHPTVVPPTQGWFPKFNVGGDWLVVGSGEVWLINLRTLQEFKVGTGWHIGWLSSTECVWFNETQVFITTVPSLTNIRHPELDYLIPSLGELAGGTIRDGHWSTILNGSCKAIWDQRDITTLVWASMLPARPYRTTHTGAFLLTARNDTYDFLLFKPDYEGYVRKVGGRAPYGAAAVGPRGEVVVAAQGHSYVSYSAAEGETDITVTPWFGDSVGQLLDVDGKTWRALWVWNERFTDIGRMLLHPLDSLECIILPCVMTWADTVYSGGLFACAGVTDKGYLTVITEIPVGTPRVVVPPLPPLPPPEIDFTITPTLVLQGETVTGAITKKTNVKTWRWLKDGQIDLPVDGDTHPFTDLAVGTRRFAIRASGDGGVVTTPEKTAMVGQRPMMLHYTGLNCDCYQNTPLAANLLAAKYFWLRNDVMAQKFDAALIAAYVAWYRQQGIEPVLIVGPSQIADCPNRVFAEVLDFRGAFPEPDLRGVDAAAYARIVNAIMPTARAKQIVVYAGCSNMMGMTDKLLWWQTFAHTLDPDVGLSVHRYPPDNKSWDSVYPGATSRADEIQQWQKVTNAKSPTNLTGRPWLLSEFGWNTGKFYTAWWEPIVDFFTHRQHHHLSEDTIQEWTTKDFLLYLMMLADGAAPYQINDAPEVINGVALESGVPEGSEAGTPFGFRFNTPDHNPWAPKPRMSAAKMMTTF